MIISASRRTDIPTYYSEWFFNRIKEGFLYVRNPMNIHQISKISLSPKVVDGIVFWTKNPIPMMKRLEELQEYIYYFQFTVNSYGKDIEPNIPSKKEVIIPAFQELSKKIGKDRVIWRYDPIFINENYTLDYHIKYFKNLVEKLADYTEKCTVSFLDLYRNTERNIKAYNIETPTIAQREILMTEFSRIAEKLGICIDTCAEDMDLSKFGIEHAHCIDAKRFERLGNYKLLLDKDKNQRGSCGCVSSIDIGAYNTCKNGCVYCYANFSQKTVEANLGKHNPNSPLLFGEVGIEDKVTEREVRSYRHGQMTIFDD